MRRIVGLMCLASLGYGCGKTSPSSTKDGTNVFYDLYKAGDSVTDQGATSPRAHSSLVGTELEDPNAQPTDFQDTDFAANVAAPALAAGASLYFSLGECFSGGFIDDLAPLHGPRSVLTSARHTETASYGFPAPDGVDVDYTDAFITALGDGKTTAEEVAAGTAALDPFGPNPDAARKTETMGSEHNQYFAADGGDALRVADHAAHGLVVIWAGMPADRDGQQIKRMIDDLVTMGYDRDRIWLLYGGGQADPTHAIVRAHIKDQTKPIHLEAATRDNLASLFKAQFAPGAKNAPDFVFFYVGDHGGLDGGATAKLGYAGPDPLVTPTLKPLPGEKLYGDGFKPRL